MSLEFKVENLWGRESRLSSRFYARRIIEKALEEFGIGGWVYEKVFHPYVVLEGQTDEEVALNQLRRTEMITVGEARQGDDITEAVMNPHGKS